MNTIISITEKYFEYCKSQKRLDDKTIKAYRVDLQQFTTFFDNTDIHTLCVSDMENFIEYLHQNFSEKITIDGLAERVYLSRSTFIRSFQVFCGCSPIQYLTKYRAKKAMELLENATMSKTEIAHSCGFYDLSHMERMIKKFHVDFV